MSGYLNREADTSKRLIDGWYDTGRQRRDDSSRFFVGRAATCSSAAERLSRRGRAARRHPR
jgi:hypothetical protein